MSTMIETETTPPAEIAASEPATVPVHRLTIDRYLRMADAGIFKKNEPVFLWRGRLAEKMTKGNRHVFAFLKLNAALASLIPAGWHLRPEQPVRFGDDGLPEPDFTVVRGTIDDYREGLPSARELALIIEVSDSSVAIDSGEVFETYAAEAIPVYWIVNLPKRRVEVHREPTGPSEAPTYRERRFYIPGERVPVVLDGQEVGTVDVSEILP
jgi:Uma2 family endonuclease